MAADFFAASYCGQPSTPLDAATRWNFDPFALTLLGIAASVYLMRRDRKGLAGVCVLALIFVSPLCALSNALFSARTLHHLLLVLVAAPLLADPARSQSIERQRWRNDADPADGRHGVGAAFAISTIVLWAWHVPALYAAALQHAPVYGLMQATLLASAGFYWRRILIASPGTALGGIVAGAMQMGLLGALLTFAQRPLYEPHLLGTASWGIAPLADQQLAGLLMWVPAMLPYAWIGWRVAAGAWRQAAPAVEHRPA